MILEQLAAPPTERPQLMTYARLWPDQRAQVVYLRSVVSQYRAEPEIRELARDIIFRINALPERVPYAHAIAIARWVQTNIRYVQELPEVFQTPLATLDTKCGDCDDQAVLVGSLLESVGIPSWLFSVGWNAPPAPDLEHIYTVADVGPPGTLDLVPLDTTLRTDIRKVQRDPLAELRRRGQEPRLFVA